MTLLVNFVLLAVGVFVLVRYLRYRSRIFLVLLAALGLAAGAYNSVRTFAHLAIDEAFIENVARTHSELSEFEYDPTGMASQRPLKNTFDGEGREYDMFIEITIDHPWHLVTQFELQSWWYVKSGKITGVLINISGKNSKYFFAITPGPDWFYSKFFISRMLLRGLSR